MVRKQSNAKKKKNSKSVFKKDNTILQNSFQNELSSFLDMENSENVGSIIKDEPVLKNINSTKSSLGSNLKTLSQTTIESVTSSYTSKLNDYDGHLVQMVKDFGNLRNNQEIQLKALSDINFTIKNCPSFIQRQITRQKLYAFGMLGALALHAESIESWQNIKEEIEIFLSSEKKDANLTSSPNREDNRIPIDIFEKLMNRFSNETEFKLMIDYLEYLSECKDVLKHVKKNQNEVLLLNKEVQTEEISMFQKQPDIKKKRTNLKIFNDIPEETMKKQEGSSSEEDENNGIESLTILSQKTNEEEKEGILKKWATATDLPSVNSTFIPCNQDPERFTDSDVLSPSASTIAFLSDEEEWRVLKDQPDTPDLGSSTNSTSQTTEPTQIENVEMVLSLTSVLTSSFHSQSTNFEMKTEKESLIAPPLPPLSVGSQGSSVDPAGIAPMSSSAPPPPALLIGSQRSSVEPSGIAPMSSSAPPPPPLPIGSQGSSVEPSGIAPMSRSAPPPPPLPVGKQGSSVDVSGIAPMSSSAPPPPPLPIGSQGSSVEPSGIAPMSRSAPPPPPLPVGKQGSSVDVSGIAPMSSSAPPPPPPLPVGKQGSSVDTSGIAPMSSSAPPPPPPLPVGKQGSSVDTSGIAPMSSSAPPPPPPLPVGKQGSSVDPTGIAPMSSSAPPPPPPLPFGKQKSSADPSGIAPLSSSAPPPPPTVPKTTSLSSSFPKGNSSTLPPPPPPPLPPWSQFAKPSTDWQSRNEFGTETTISPSLSPGIVKAAIVYKKEKKTVLARWQKLSPMQMQGAVTVFNDSFCVDFNEEERKKMEEIFEEAPIKQPLKRIGGSVGRNFGAKITARAAISSTDISSSNSKSPTNAQLLCSSKALTLEIVLKKLRPLTFTDLITKLETNETNDIKVDLMTTLHANYPDADELAIFENVEFKDLSHASDQFCWHISRKKTLKLRIELLITKENVTAEINKFQQQVEQMMTACNLARSDIIQTLLRKCLQYGNYLNQGSMFAEAAGFSLSYLTALLQLKGKGSNSSIRLVDLLVSFCDLSTLEIEEIQQKMSDVRSLVLKDLESAVDQAEKTVKKLNNAMKKTEDQSLILSYESFMKKTMEKLENVRNGVQELRTREVELRAYLCAKDMNLQNIFEIIENAMRIVRDAIKQLAEKARVQRTTSMVVLPSSSISQRSLREGEMTLSRRSLALKSRDLPVEELKKLFSHQSFGHQRVKKTSPLATSNEDGSSVSSRQQNIRSRTREMKGNEIQQMNEISSSIGSPV